MDRYLEDTQRLCDFLSSSPTAFHAVRNAEEKLVASGFKLLSESERFRIQPGNSYYVKRNGTALIAFRVPERLEGFHIVAAHTDSPCFKIKHDPEITSSGLYTTLNVEGYGGLLLNPWFDRPLSIAGRVVLSDGEERLVDFDRDLVLIPSLAIHMDRGVNDGRKLSKQKDTCPLFAEGVRKGSFEELLSKELGRGKEDILEYDLYVYSRTKPTLWGLEDEFFSSPRIDDLGCAFSGLDALLESNAGRHMPVLALFDNEEVGSGTRQGALSDFLRNTLRRVSLSLSLDEEEWMMLLSSSRMLSADNGHAVHPNYKEKADPTNQPRLNGGVLVKFAANQKYTTDAASGSFVTGLCKSKGIPFQRFFNHSDSPGGSTLGNLSTQKVSIRTADVGIAQLAMHSPYETAGTRDTTALMRLFKEFYSL